MCKQPKRPCCGPRLPRPWACSCKLSAPAMEAGDCEGLLALSGHRHASACSIELDAIRCEPPASLRLMPAPPQRPAAVPT